MSTPHPEAPAEGPDPADPASQPDEADDSADVPTMAVKPI